MIVMDEARLRTWLELEIDRWCKKSPEELIEALNFPVAYEQGAGEEWRQVEVQLLENTDDYVHVGMAVDDGSEELSRCPLTTSFLVHHDGRIDR